MPLDMVVVQRLAAPGTENDRKNCWKLAVLEFMSMARSSWN